VLAQGKLHRNLLISRHAKDPKACCRPCNMIKGKRVYKNFEDAKKYVLARREEMHQGWQAKHSKPLAKAASG
jgi:hypothetical protein